MCIQKLLYIIYKINLKCIVDKNMGTKTIKHLDKNMEENFHDLTVAKDFLNIKPRSLKEIFKRHYYENENISHRMG